MSASARRRHRRGGRKRNPFLLALVVLASVGAMSAMIGGLYVLGVAAQTPPIDELQPVDEGANSIIYAADGSRLGFIQSDQARTPIGLEKMPQELREATVAIEDERFYDHGGVDLEGVVRAAVNNFEAGETKQGGSTITQQLARNLYIEDPKRDLERKIKEAKLAEELEDAHDKDWILEQYLNTASYGTVQGRTAVGVEAASQIYFSKPAKDLDLAESALLAGLPQSPSQYNPFLNESGAIDRRNEVLDKMAELEYITQEEADDASQEGLELEPGDKYTTIREPYFFDYVEQQLIDDYGYNTVRRGGLKVYTTIDPELQEAGRAAIDGNLGLPDDPSSAVVAIDPRNGYVKAMASSGNYAHEQYNLAAQGHRQAGSAFKTFALVTAVRRGIDPDSTFYTSKPLDLDLPEYGHWEVSTYSDSYSGTMSLHDATLQSDNTVYAQLSLDLGPDSVADTAHDMGIVSELDGIPSETLGGLRVGVSPLEMANAYATLASGGVRNEPIAIKSVKFPNGDEDDLGEPDRQRVFSDGVADTVRQILIDNVVGGTGTSANVSACTEDGGKTGTTDNFNDAWFAGWAGPNLAAASWVGYPDALRSMSSVHGTAVAGGTFPASIWGDFMNSVISSCEPFPEVKEPVEFVPFHGEFSSESGSSCSSSGSFDELSGSGGSCGAPAEAPVVEEDPEKDNDSGGGSDGGGGGSDGGNYAPGKQPPSKPAPAPAPAPEPTPAPAPPGPPSGGVTP
jgi:penicillin-binding protein 1A